MEQVIDNLPYGMRSSDQWKSRARAVASEALKSAPADAGVAHMAALATLAMGPLQTEYNHKEKLKNALAAVTVPGATIDEEAEARETAHAAVDELPFGSGDRQIQKVITNALAEIRERVSARVERERDQAARDQILSRIPLLLLGCECDKQAAADEVKEGLAELAAGTSIKTLEKVRDQVVDRYRRKATLIVGAVDEIHSYAKELVDEFDFKGDSALTVTWRVEPKVKRILWDELDGTETARSVSDRMREIVDKLENVE